MKLNRHLDSALQEHFSKYREVLILLGSRQCGKTTLVNRLFPEAQYLLVDNEPARKALETYDVHTYQSIFKPQNGCVVIDEIHLVRDPGRAVKIIYDQMPLKLIITGSSSFHIKNRTAESLAGRKIDYFLYPLTFSEYLFQNSVDTSLNFNIFNNILQGCRQNPPARLFDMQSILSLVLLYGQYPAMLNHPADRLYLENFIDSLIFKDLLELQLIDNRRAALNLLKLLAYQIGNIINYSELANKLQIDQRTVKRYIEIFEQCFIIFRLYPFAGNRQDEIVKSPKIYFFDTGIRNVLINDFSEIDLRPDSGAMFENFIVSEVFKANRYLNAGYKLHFWRTKQGAEVDLVLTSGKEIRAVEIKSKKSTFSTAFKSRFPKASCGIATMDNFY